MQTIGERLEEARKKKGASIREAAEATKVRGEYLLKFEGNQFNIGLTDIYVRGFLRGYASFLKLPADRILNDYAALGHGEARARQPSREVYGRMDLSVSPDDERGETAAAQPEAPAAAEPARQISHVPRGQSGPAIGSGINPALVFKGGIALAVLVVVLLLAWGVKSILGGGGAPAAPSRNSAAAAATAQPIPDPTVSVVALEPVRIKVARQSDGSELFQGPLARGERKDFANVPLFLTSTALESVAIEYKGKQYPTGQKGYSRVKFDFSGQ